MNVNIDLNIGRDVLQEHREVLLVAHPELAISPWPVLIPDEDNEHLGAYQVWWPVINDADDSMFLYVDSEGVEIMKEEISPKDWFIH